MTDNRFVVAGGGVRNGGWIRWWQGLDPARRYIPLLVLALYVGILYVLGGFERDPASVERYVIFTAIMLVFSYGGERARKAGKFFLPIILMLVLFDSLHYWGRLVGGTVHVAEPYFFEKKYFGITVAGEVIIPGRWLQAYVNPFFDVIAGVTYLMFIPGLVLFAAYITLWAGGRGTKKRSAEYISKRSSRILWSFLVLNVLGWATWYIYPAAPPWYVEKYGLGPTDLGVPASAAGLVRFDELLGVGLFQGFYSGSETVFGAIPSLHAAYAFLAVYFSVKFGAARFISFVFFVAMGFAAVYLEHHYVLDVVLGALYGLVGALLTDYVADRFIPLLPFAPPAPPP